MKTCKNQFNEVEGHALSLWNKLWKIFDKCIYVKEKVERQFKLHSLYAMKKIMWFILVFIIKKLDFVYMSQNALIREIFQNIFFL